MTTTSTATSSRWTVVAPVVAFVVLIATWNRSLSPVVAILVALILGAAVLAAVHHAEVIAFRVGEPFGSLVLAVAVTVIEVALIVALIVAGDAKSETLARDTVFSALMITCNGMVGISLLIVALRHRVVRFQAPGVVGALATIATLATLTLVLPTFTTSAPGPVYTPIQLAFAAIASLVLYGLFVFVQTIRNRGYFLPLDRDGNVLDDEADSGLTAPSDRETLGSVGLLLVCLVAVVGIAKTLSPSIEDLVSAAGAPISVVGVAIAGLVLLPETLAAARAAQRDRVQTSLNLAYGSALATIGLTIPTIAVASIWLDGPLTLGLGAREIVLLALTIVVGALTVQQARVTILQAGVHLSVFAAFLFLAFSP
jgi:Ca2+:H+ antiporter